MTPAEIYASGAGQFMRADEYEQAGIKLVDNTPEEIKAVVKEMADGMPFIDDQAEFWKDFPRSISPYTGQPLHGEIRLRIGSEFLKAYSLSGTDGTDAVTLENFAPSTSPVLRSGCKLVESNDDNLMCYYG